MIYEARTTSVSQQFEFGDSIWSCFSNEHGVWERIVEDWLENKSGEEDDEWW